MANIKYINQLNDILLRESIESHSLQFLIEQNDEKGFMASLKDILKRDLGSYGVLSTRIDPEPGSLRRYAKKLNKAAEELAGKNLLSIENELQTKAAEFKKYAKDPAISGIISRMVKRHKNNPSKLLDVINIINDYQANVAAMVKEVSDYAENVLKQYENYDPDTSFEIQIPRVSPVSYKNFKKNLPKLASETGFFKSVGISPLVKALYKPNELALAILQSSPNEAASYRKTSKEMKFRDADSSNILDAISALKNASLKAGAKAKELMNLDNGMQLNT